MPGASAPLLLFIFAFFHCRILQDIAIHLADVDTSMVEVQVRIWTDLGVVRGHSPTCFHQVLKLQRGVAIMSVIAGNSQEQDPLTHVRPR